MLACHFRLLPAVALALVAPHRTVEGFAGNTPTHSCSDDPRRRRRNQVTGAFCDQESDKCNPCGALKPKPNKPDGSYDAASAVEAIAKGGFSVLRSKFFDSALKAIGGASGWGYVGAGVLDGITGAVDAAKQKAEWNRYKLESFISNSTDYVVCEVKAIVGDYFKEYMDMQDLCHYNMGIDGMADFWLSSCHSRQCLNLTDLPADQRGDCCSASEEVGNSLDCQGFTDEQIGMGQGHCRLQGESFKPGSGVCTRYRVCRKCMDLDRAIEMTQAQIESYKAYPTNWGAALEGYANIDAIIAQARGTMMMLAYYQESILLGATAALGNFQLFARTAYQQMQGKIDTLMASAPGVVSKSSCTLSTPPEVNHDDACQLQLSDFCLYSRMGCRGAYSMVGMDGCVDVGRLFCRGHENCSVCTHSLGCDKVSCYDAINDDDRAYSCTNWASVWREEKAKAATTLKAHYVATLASISRFLDILLNYSQEPLSSSVFGAYRRVGYRMPSCDANTASQASIAQCQHDTLLSKGPGLPHSHFHP